MTFMTALKGKLLEVLEIHRLYFHDLKKEEVLKEFIEELNQFHPSISLLEIILKKDPTFKVYNVHSKVIKYQLICLLKKRVVISTFVPLPINPTTTFCRFILVMSYDSTKYVRAKPFLQMLGK